MANLMADGMPTTADTMFTSNKSGTIHVNLGLTLAHLRLVHRWRHLARKLVEVVTNFFLESQSE
jgi:hypothetical protein